MQLLIHVLGLKVNAEAGNVAVKCVKKGHDKALDLGLLKRGSFAETILVVNSYVVLAIKTETVQ